MASSSSSKHGGNDQFHQEYAKSLAKALEERLAAAEESFSKENWVHDAYVALCHDDPHVDSDESCRLLANALTCTTTTTTSCATTKEEDSHYYRLSERLVEGVRQTTGRTVNNNNNDGPTTDASPEGQDQDNGAELVVWRSTGGVATAAGYATLAFTCFVKIPLRCCQSSDIAVVKDFLGSYRGPKRRQEDNAGRRRSNDDSRDAHASLEDERMKDVAEGLSAMGQHLDSDDYSSSNKKGNEIISLEEEVWAAESDPSDFEYESSHDPQQALKELEMWTEAFDPIALSKPPPSTSDWIDLRQGVANLLSELSYSKVAPLSKQQWNSLRVSDLLSQLTLTLLIQPENASTALLDDELQQLGIRPLFVLRDRVASHGEELGDYLTLVQTLVAVDAAAASAAAAPIIIHNRSSSTTSSLLLAPATVVGLGALSALCHVSLHGNNNSNNAPQQQHQRIRQCVLETSEDLAHVMEKSRCSNSSATAIIHVMWTLLPLLDRLTNVRPDGSTSTSTSSPWESSPLTTNDDAQILLQSGMFRELILFITQESSSLSAAAVAAQTQLLRSLQIMCIQSPSLLGKYAWRVLDLAKIVQTNEFAQEHIVDGLVWNLLGTSLADNGGGGGAVRLLRPKNVPPVVVVTTTVGICRERNVNNLERLCKDAEKTMDGIQSLRTGRNDDDNNNNAEDDAGWKKEPIQELSRFCNYLVSCPNLALFWQKTATADDVALQRVQSSVRSLGNVLSSLARIPESPVGKVKTDKKKSADNNDKQAGGDPLLKKRPKPYYYGEHEEACVRKAIKILSASWQSPSQHGRDILSSKTD